jgi:hypothetical protein
MLYDATAHPLLSVQATQLAPEVLVEQNELAETLLELTGTNLTGTAKETATRAVALQIAFQLEMGVEGYVFASESQGDRSGTYRGTGQAPSVHPMAATLVASVIGRSPKARRLLAVRSVR